jgi:hypothetical protein
MTAKDKGEKPVFRPGGVSRLLDDRGKDMTDDERALLLALVGVEAQAGQSLTEQDHAALDRLKEQVQEYDADALSQAIAHVVTAKPSEDRKLEWPDLRRAKDRDSAGE